MEEEEKERDIYDTSKDCLVHILNTCEESGLTPSEFVIVAIYAAYNAAKCFLVVKQKDGEEINMKAINEQAKKIVTESINLL